MASRVYEKQFGSKPTKQELLALAKSIRSLIITLAQGDVFILSRVRNLTKNSVNGAGDSYYEQSFFIAKKGELLTLELKPSILDEVDLDAQHELPRISSLTTGCPALVAPGAEGRNVISEYYDWFMDIYERIYLPELKRMGELKPE